MNDIGPVRIGPVLVERVWGVRQLGSWSSAIVGPDSAPVGEAWLTELSCPIDQGGSFGDLIARSPAQALGDAAGSPPILVKLLFTAAALSVQVHPTDAAARASGIGPFGKNEAWHVLEAAPDAAVWVGFKRPVTPAALRAAAANGSVLELMHRKPVRAGDTVPVPAGTVHAIGPGLVLLEVQDAVQVTYRLYDYGRPRPLQLEEALAVADLGPATGYGPDAPAAPVLVQAPRFVLERHTIEGELFLRPNGNRAHILIPLTPGVRLNGSALLQGGAASVPAHGGVAALGGSQASLAVVHAGPGASPCLRAT